MEFQGSWFGLENALNLRQPSRSMVEIELKAVAFGAAGRKQVEDEFSASLMANRTTDLYRTLTTAVNVIAPRL